MLHWYFHVKDIAFQDLSPNHWLVNRHGNLFSCSRLSDILSLILDPHHLSDASPTAVDQRIFRLDHTIKDLNPNDSRITSAKHEAFQKPDFSRSYEKIHLRLRTSQFLSADPSRIILQDMIDNVPLENLNLG